MKNIICDIVFLVVAVVLLYFCVWLSSCTFINVDGNGATINTEKKIKLKEKPLLKKVLPP